MPPSVAELRLCSSAETAIVIFLEGVDVAFTTDESGDLHGTSWITELHGVRRVVPGLAFPTGLGDHLDIDTGQIEDRIQTFKIVDVEGILPALFKRSHRVEGVLAKTLRAGRGLETTAMTVKSKPGVESIRGKHLGTESIGPNGERRYLECFPFDVSTPGEEHPVDFEDNMRLPVVGITDTPSVFQGRRVSVYMLYKDPAKSGASAWAPWKEQHDAGGLLWKGTMRAKGKIQANRTWSFSCLGTESMLSRQLGIRSQSGWTPVTGSIALADLSENLIAVECTDVNAGGTLTIYDSAAFDTSQKVTGTSPTTIASSVSSIVTAVTTAATANRPSTPPGAWTDSDHRVTVDVGLISVGTAPDPLTAPALTLVMHIKVWRALGFEPREQNLLWENDPKDEKAMSFYRVGQTERFGSAGDLVPGPDFWRGRTTTNRDPANADGVAGIGNNGIDMPWQGVSTVGFLSLDARGTSQGSGGAASPLDLAIGSAPARIEGQNTIPHSDAVLSGTTEADSARYFEFKGRTVKVDGDTLEQIEFRTVGRLSWIDTNGHPSDGPDGLPRVNIDQFVDPRPFGMNEMTLTSGIVFETGEMNIRPLTAWAYMEDISKPDRLQEAHQILSQILLSSGTGPGYSGADNTNPTLTPGQNQKGYGAGDSQFGDDLEIADMGLTFPRELVADAPAFRDAFGHISAGYKDDFNRVRYAYSGSIDSKKIFQSIMEPRRLAWSLHGNVLTPIFIGPVGSDVDFELTESDMAKIEGPDTEQNVTRPISSAMLSYRYDIGEGSTNNTERASARDRGAYTRTEGEERKITDHGLVPPAWYNFAMKGFLGAGDWTPEFRRLWGQDAAEFYSAPHFMVTLEVSRIKGQDIRIGSTVMVTNPWPVAPTGTYGLAQDPGLVVGTSYNTKTDKCMVDVLVFATPATLYFSPYLEVIGFDGNDVLFDKDPGAFIEPAHSALGGDAAVQILGYDRADWEVLHSTTITARVAGQNRLTMAAPITGAFRDKFKYMIMNKTQTAAWVSALYGVTTRPDGTFDTGPEVDGDRFGDA